MKMISLFAVATLVLLVSCNGLRNPDNVKETIPGTYISAWKTEFSESVDTLLIEPLMKQGSETYAITRRIHVSFFYKDRKRDPEYRITRWTGSYSPGDKTLVVNNNGRVLSFDPTNREMKMGVTTYRKL